MRLWGSALLILGVALLVTEPAGAQQRQRQGRGGFGGGFGGGAMLLANSGVQAELKMTDEQKEKAKKFAEEMFAKAGEQRRSIGDPQSEEGRKKLQELRKKMAEESDKAIKEILKPEQLKRLNQISLQQRGVGGFADEKVQAALKLNDEQKGKLKDLADQTRKEEGEIFQQGAQGNREEAAKKRAELRKSSMEKALGILNDEQKKAWKELTGEPYEVKFERRPRGAGNGSEGARRRPRGEPQEKKPLF